MDVDDGSTGVIVGVVVVILLLIGAGVGYWFVKGKQGGAGKAGSSPEPVQNQKYDQVPAQDIEAEWFSPAQYFLFVLCRLEELKTDYLRHVSFIGGHSVFSLFCYVDNNKQLTLSHALDVISNISFKWNIKMMIRWMIDDYWKKMLS